jgi:hypothetical protein
VSELQVVPRNLSSHPDRHVTTISKLAICRTCTCKLIWVFIASVRIVEKVNIFILEVEGFRMVAGYGFAG